MVDCTPIEPPPFGWICTDDDDVVVALTPFVDGDGTPLVQGPLRSCGTNEILCPDTQVSKCLVDSSGAPTSYGTAPVGSPPISLGAHPRISRIRINRAGETVFPYSVANHPDQLVDIVIDDGVNPDIVVPFDAPNGRFIFPPYPEIPEIPEIPDYIPHYRAVEVSEIAIPGVSAADTRLESPIDTVTNPHPTLSMSVVFHMNIQLGVALLPEGKAVVQPQLYYNGVWGGSTWEQETFPNKSGVGISGGIQINFVDHHVLAPGASRTFALGVTVANATVGSIFLVQPVNMHMLAVGDNYDT